MLETLDFSIEPFPKDEYKLRYNNLIQQLIALQQQARQREVGVVVLFEGWNGSGKGSRISDLMYNLDARATSVHFTRDLEPQRMADFAGFQHGVVDYFPAMKDFWGALGERGTMTFFDRGWYLNAVQRMIYGGFDQVSSSDEKGFLQKDLDIDEAHIVKSRGLLQLSLSSVAEFERQLIDDGYVVVKFFIHMTKDAQKKRLNRLYNNPATKWRVSDEKLAATKYYERAYTLYDNLLEGSNRPGALWTVVNGEDKRRANLHIAETLVRAFSEALDPFRDKEAPNPKAAVNLETTEHPLSAPTTSRFLLSDQTTFLDGIDRTLLLDQTTYKTQLKKEQKRLRELENEMFQKRIPLILMYEGWDAAGKGGVIKRVAQALDARAYTIFPSPAPTKPELLHPHLWRYWTRLPKAGHVGIYDRSWYGRVLVERVEGFASYEQWSRAYDEINAFEQDLLRWGALVLKFWVEVSPDEQLNRFHERQNDSAKQWKITDEDWRNRDRYPQYKAAIDDMFRLTSTVNAPWIVLESDDKRYARIKSLKIINDTLQARLRES